MGKIVKFRCGPISILGMVIVLLCCVQCDSARPGTDSALIYKQAFDTAVEYMRQHNVRAIGEYKELRIYPDTTKKEYREIQCGRASPYEAALCREKVLDSPEHKEKVEKFAQIGRKAALDREAMKSTPYVIAQCVKASAESRSRCEKGLTINHEYFSHIGDEEKVTIVHFIKKPAGEVFLSDIETLLILDAAAKKVVGYYELSGGLSAQ